MIVTLKQMIEVRWWANAARMTLLDNQDRRDDEKSPENRWHERTRECDWPARAIEHRCFLESDSSRMKIVWQTNIEHMRQ
jgi:hypothetical protein